jgi:hypothetical protein
MAIALFLLFVCCGAVLYIIRTEKPVPAAEQVPAPAPAVRSAASRPSSKIRILFDTYRHIEKVHLRDGTILLGVLHETEAIMELITPEGKLNLSRDDIVRVEYMNPDKL